jgi:hypothetical protein
LDPDLANQFQEKVNVLRTGRQEKQTCASAIIGIDSTLLKEQLTCPSIDTSTAIQQGTKLNEDNRTNNTPGRQQEPFLILFSADF